MAEPSRDHSRLAKLLKLEEVPDLDATRIANLPAYVRTSYNILLSKIAALRELSDTDDLTKLKSRRAIRKELDGMLERRLHASLKRRTGKKHITYPDTAVILLDMDDFGKFNKEHSVIAGDTALKHVAKMLREELFNIDSIARPGGDEFIVIMREANEQQAREKMAAVIKKIEETPFYYTKPEERDPDTGAIIVPSLDIPLHVSISFGVAQLKETDSPNDIIERADAALRKVKALKKGTAINRPLAPTEDLSGAKDGTLQIDPNASFTRIPQYDTGEAKKDSHASNEDRPKNDKGFSANTRPKRIEDIKHDRQMGDDGQSPSIS